MKIKILIYILIVFILITAVFLACISYIFNGHFEEVKKYPLSENQYFVELYQSNGLNHDIRQIELRTQFFKYFLWSEVKASFRAECGEFIWDLKSQKIILKLTHIESCKLEMQSVPEIIDLSP